MDSITRLTHVPALHMHVSKQVKHIHLILFNTFTADCPRRTTEIKVVETIVRELHTLILTTLTGFPPVHDHYMQLKH